MQTITEEERRLKKRTYITTLTIIWLALFFIDANIVQADQKTYQVGTNKLSLRAAPDPNAAIVGELRGGQQVTAFKEHYGWVQTYYEGKEAWVAAHYLVSEETKTKTEEKAKAKPKKEKAITTSIQIIEDAARLRMEPHIDADVLALGKKGEQYTVLDTQYDWHQIKLQDGKTAWIAAWLTTDIATSEVAEQKQPTSSSPANLSSNALANLNIMLDPGHGGKDPGAIGINGEYEKDLTLHMTKIIADKLESYGATVTLTRSTDRFVSLEDRIKINDAYWTDAFISLHFNAFTSESSNGVSTHYYADNEDFRLAQQVQTALLEHTGLNDRGVRQDNYYILRENKDTAILVELGFITNAGDLSNIRSNDYANKVGEALAQGLAKQ